MKVLIAITSCARDVANGDNQAVRETWVPTLSQYGYDYRFFVGVGQTPKQEEFHLNFAADSHKHATREPVLAQSVPLDRSLLKGDEILVDCDDSWIYLPYKIRESRKWAQAEGYDHVFKVDVDTYLHAGRLQFNDDWWGCDTSWDAEAARLGVRYTGGWLGYSLSKKAYSLTVDAPITWAAEDWWTGSVLQAHGIPIRTWAVQPTEISHVKRGVPSAQWIREFHKKVAR